VNQTEMFEEVGKLKGQFLIDGHGAVRHKRMMDAEGEMACPLVVLCRRKKLGRFDNGQVFTMGSALGLRYKAINALVGAADGKYGSPRSRSRLLKALGLKEKGEEKG
jgi:hypothetical protein